MFKNSWSSPRVSCVILEGIPGQVPEGVFYGILQKKTSLEIFEEFPRRMSETTFEGILNPNVVYKIWLE